MNAKSIPLLIAMILPATVSLAAQGQERRIDAATGEEVGVSGHDGITISGGTVLVTRNGSTEQLNADLSLSGGTRVSPEGKITFPSGRTVTLGAQQLLTFDGRLLELPITTSPPASVPAAPAGSAGTPVQGNAQVNTTVGGTRNLNNRNGAIDGGFAGTGTLGTGITGLTDLTPQTATSVTTDPRTGQPVYTAINPATGQPITTTTDPRTGLTITTTTDQSGNRITRTTNPQTGLPTTTVTDSSGRTQTYSGATGTTSGTTSGTATGTTTGTPTLGTNGTTNTRTGTTNTTTGSGTSTRLRSGTTSGSGTRFNGTSGGTGTSGGGTSGGTAR